MARLPEAVQPGGLQKALSESPTTTSTGTWIPVEKPNPATAVLSSPTVVVSLFFSSILMMRRS